MATNRGRYGWNLGVVSLLMIVTSWRQALAQIVPDSTLSTESSVVEPQNPGSPVNEISGGATRGTNLFHSFEQFSVLTRHTAYFNNAADIQNIITRVTGSSLSSIDGLLRANGTANLFLINPNGIIFGPNARLDIGGSFLASTASSLNFADKTQFSATASQTQPLLSISVPIGLQFGGTVANIRVQGAGNNLSLDPETFAFVRDENALGLKVQSGETLALVGGNVTLNGGNLIAEGGRIEVGSVAGSGLVSLAQNDPGWKLGYEGVPSLQDIQLSQQASVDASGEGGGDIQLQGRRITITDGSAIFALTLGSKPGGTLAINASDSLELIGTSANSLFPSAIFIDNQGAGAGGELTINTRQLLVRDGAEVTSDAVDVGNGGKLTVNASESVQLVGTSADINLLSSGLFTTGNVGSSGDLMINTRQLLVQDGAQVSTSTSGAGNGGELTINASESVQLIGTSPSNNDYRSGLFAETTGAGAGGTLTINTRQLLVRDGAVVSSAPYSTGVGGTLTVNASDSVQLIGESADGRSPSGLATAVQEEATGAGGDLTVTTRQLSVRDGARLSTSTFGAGQGGKLQIDASESIELSGIGPYSQEPSLVAARTRGTGAAGDLTINTRQLTVRDGSQVTVSSTGLGSGQAGNLEITAKSIQLDNQAQLTSETDSGQGGNIRLQDLDLLLLRNNSKISTTAGNAQFSGDGGNININTDFIVAFPSENSDITANAFTGRGGQVEISAQGVFGAVSRSLEELKTLLETNNPNQIDPNQLLSSDITAISQTNPSLSGQVVLNTPDINLSSGLVELPDQPVEAQVLQTCQPGTNQEQSEFVVTGRGGLPPSPRGVLMGDAIAVGWASLKPDAEQQSSSTSATTLTTPPASIVEAQGWIVGRSGEVVLTASASSAPPTWNSQANCRAH